MTVRLSHLRAWLDCEFCELPYEFRVQASGKGEPPMPTLSDAVKEHYWSSEHGSYLFRPCPRKDLWRDTNCQLIDQDTGAVVQQAKLVFDQHGSFDVT